MIIEYKLNAFNWLIASIAVFYFSVVGAPAFAQSSPSCKAMYECTSTYGYSSPKCLDVAKQCASGADKTIAKTNERRRSQGSDCTDLLGDCNLTCSGNNMISCFQRCADRAQVCRDKERSERRRTSSNKINRDRYTNPNRSPVTRTPSGDSNSPRVNTYNSDQGSTQTITGSNNSQSMTQPKVSESVTPEIMSKVALMGASGAMNCVTLVKGNSGYLSLKNICEEKINYHYCYDKWVPNPNVAGGNNNPFKCDLNGKLSFSGADSISGLKTKALPLQSGALRKRTRVGPCMDVVLESGIRYNYLSSKRTGGQTGNEYRCNYYRASFK